MSESEILARIHNLVETEHALRNMVESESISPAEEQQRLAEIERTLDQCWDLLRQRRARRSAGQLPEAAEVRPVDQVEGYLQ
ncbi:DUF2630 family protein [Smaragdicoccus niigatensis]|uniref:DUF2630 family protein n=1 Tax=Smaragdicoccus niigatensis TaxID=359359 RepID=UPI000369A2C8|nr:DUF2630 family protein [Smaragdicoccus niigatensis]